MTKTKAFKLAGKTYTVTFNTKDTDWVLTVDGEPSPVAVGMFQHGMLDTESAIPSKLFEKVETILAWMQGDPNATVD